MVKQINKTGMNAKTEQKIKNQLLKAGFKSKNHNKVFTRDFNVPLSKGIVTVCFNTHFLERGIYVDVYRLGMWDEIIDVDLTEGRINKVLQSLK